MVNSLYLSHHGVKGQKWGIRRFQYKDGSLTPAGQRRAAKMRTAYTQLTGKKLRSHPESLKKSSDKSKSGGKTSDADDQITKLKKQKELLTAKKDVLELQNKISELTPKKVSAGKKFIEKFGPTIAKNVWEGALKNNVNKWIENKLGLKVPESESNKLANKAKDMQNRYNSLKYENLIKEELNKRKKNQGNTSDKTNSDKTNGEKSPNSGSNKSSKQNEQKSESRGGQSSKTSDGTKSSKTEESKTERYTGTVEGKGTSHVDPRKYYTVDADYRDVKSSNTSSGERFISGLLESGAGILRLEDKRMG
ncbi:hypothetical protein [Blautia glucerasea]|uniref:hypothetical protein n=1 Tax=Blautia glucerasea TaxID=536633 RepID=UPI00156EE910|nr:hypothetical protein [Blautia glucerasea]NSJ25525.1 hypothetical protein [Blautia glucerasea]